MRRVPKLSTKIVAELVDAPIGYMAPSYFSISARLKKPAELVPKWFRFLSHFRPRAFDPFRAADLQLYRESVHPCRIGNTNVAPLPYTRPPVVISLVIGSPMENFGSRN